MTRLFSAGGIVYKKEKAKTLWLLRRPAPNPEYKGPLGWNLPRGLIDTAEKMEEAAVREVREEVGVQAKIIHKLPAIKIFFVDAKTSDKVLKFITFYVMEWQNDLPEGFGWETAETKWVDLEQAIKLLEYANERELLQKAAEVVAKPTQEGLAL